MLKFSKEYVCRLPLFLSDSKLALEKVTRFIPNRWQLLIVQFLLSWQKLFGWRVKNKSSDLVKFESRGKVWYRIITVHLLKGSDKRHHGQSFLSICVWNEQSWIKFLINIISILQDTTYMMSHISWFLSRKPHHTEKQSYGFDFGVKSKIRSHIFALAVFF